MANSVSVRLVLDPNEKAIVCYEYFGDTNGKTSYRSRFHTLTEFSKILNEYSLGKRQPLHYRFKPTELATVLQVDGKHIALVIAKQALDNTTFIASGTVDDLKSFFLTAIGFGLLPQSRSFLIKTDDLLLQKQNYIIRSVRYDDLEILWELECLCWEEEYRTSKELLQRRMETFSRGNFIAEQNGTVLGVIYSQRLRNVEELYDRTWRNVHELHDDNGAHGQLIVLNVDARLRSRGIGAQLLTVALTHFRLIGGVDGVYGVTLTRRQRNDTAHRHLDFDAYMQLKDDQGRCVDPVLRFHTTHGAHIQGLVPNYRPNDPANCDNGILIKYDV